MIPKEKIEQASKESFPDDEGALFLHYDDIDIWNEAFMAGVKFAEKELNQWVPVSERLPEEKDLDKYGRTLVLNFYGDTSICKLEFDIEYGAQWIANNKSIVINPAITHWMKIPYL